MVNGASNLYQKIISITEDYLGPAAKRFVDRQLQYHVGKKHENFSKRDLAEFIDWSRIALAILTEDRSLIDEYIGRLEDLAS